MTHDTCETLVIESGWLVGGICSPLFEPPELPEPLVGCTQCLLTLCDINVMFPGKQLQGSP